MSAAAGGVLLSLRAAGRAGRFPGFLAAFLVLSEGARAQRGNGLPTSGFTSCCGT